MIISYARRGLSSTNYDYGGYVAIHMQMDVGMGRSKLETAPFPSDPLITSSADDVRGNDLNGSLWRPFLK